MKIDVLTLFPEMFSGPLNESILSRAAEKGLFSFGTTNFRDFTKSKHGRVDDYPFGGGQGMVLQAEPLYEALQKVKETNQGKVILTSPTGIPFNQQLARDLAKEEHLIFICGHYEGVDERVKDLMVDMEISLGDYVLTGGELAAMVMIDAIVRLVPGVISEGSGEEESFENGLLEYPHYTRPRVFMGRSVPEELLSGNHEKIRKWRLKESLRKTLMKRKDLLQDRLLNKEEDKLLQEILQELNSEGGNEHGFD